MRYLLDSNIVIALMARHVGVTGRLTKLTPGDVALPSIVMFELMFGAFNSTRPAENLDRLARLAFPVAEFDLDDARAAGEVRAALKRRGTPIGPYDVMIAGQALARNLILVTANVREFERVASLRIEDWTLP